MEWLSHLSDRLLTAWHERAIVLKALSFGIVGVINFAVDFSVLFLARAALMSSSTVTESATAVAAWSNFLDPEQWILIPANLFAWLVAVSGSYVMNSLTTFAHESNRKLTRRAYATFVVSGIAGAIANTAIVVFARGFLPLGYAKLIATFVGFVVNFSLSHFVVFRKRPDMREAEAKAQTDRPPTSLA
jgi:putative flippase GtrA